MADKKFIPDSDSGFARLARNFAVSIARNPGRYFVSTDDVEIITRAVNAYRDALAIAIQPSRRTRSTICFKDETRAEAERIVRKYARVIRVDDRISRTDKASLSVRERPTKLRRRRCPRWAPYLRFVRSDGYGGHSGGVHVLAFRESVESMRKAKPRGAARLELFMEYVGPGEAIPHSPDEGGRRPCYLRSFTTTPIRVEFPMPDEPALIVYWGRWADATGAVGPFSKTIVTRIEGWAGHRMAIAGPGAGPSMDGIRAA